METASRSRNFVRVIERVERDGVEWATPSNLGQQLKVRATAVRDWIRDGLLVETADERTEVRRDGRRIWVRVDAGERVELDTRGKGRPRSA